ncbi:hypothetical protein M3J09_011568 [Ascochyta lentis]
MGGERHSQARCVTGCSTCLPGLRRRKTLRAQFIIAALTGRRGRHHLRSRWSLVTYSHRASSTDLRYCH